MSFSLWVRPHSLAPSNLLGGERIPGDQLITGDAAETTRDDSRVTSRGCTILLMKDEPCGGHLRAKRRRERVEVVRRHAMPLHHPRRDLGSSFDINHTRFAGIRTEGSFARKCLFKVLTRVCTLMLL